MQFASRHPFLVSYYIQVEIVKREDLPIYHASQMDYPLPLYCFDLVWVAELL